jgi:hypothetical protein
MNTQKLTQTTKFSLSSVLNAEFKSVADSVLVQNLQKRVSTKNLKGSTVGLPKKLEPRSNELSVGSILALLARDSRQKNILRVLSSLQILISIKSDLVSLSLSFSYLGLRKLNELLDSNFQSRSRGALHKLLVLIKTVLNHTTLAESDSKINKSENNRFQKRDADISGTLRSQSLIEEFKSGGRLVDGDELIGTL